MFFASVRQYAACIAAVMVTAAALPARALEPATPIARLGRQAWNMENGLPQNTVPVLLQSRSGYLWAGTELGLARFDGVSFHVFDHATAPPFPDAEIRCLLDANAGKADSSSNDDLWVGSADGLAHWKNAHWTVLKVADGLPGNAVRGLAQTTDGAIWAWTEDGLARWAGGRFTKIPLLNGGEITSIAADSQGTLWVGTANGVASFRDGRWIWRVPSDASGSSQRNAVHSADALSARRPSLVTATSGGDVLIASDDGVSLIHNGSSSSILASVALPEDGVRFLARLTDGTFAIASKSMVVLVRADEGRAPSRFSVSRQLPGSRINAVLADREGCLWVGTNRGLARISAAQSAVDVLPATDALASNAVVAITEDREGDLWVGTEAAGVHILRDARFHVLGTSDGLSSDSATAVVEDAHHDVWVGTRNGGLNRISGGRTTTLTTANGLLSNVILSLAVSKDALWVGTPDGLNRIDSRGVTSITSGEGLPDDFIRSLLVEPDDSLWIGTRRGLTRLKNGRFETLTQAEGLGSDLVGALARADTGDLWIATLNGLTRLQSGTSTGGHAAQLHNYTTKDGLSSNVITALEAAPHGMVWVGTQGDGIDLWDGERFRPVRRQGAGVAPLPAAIHAIAQDRVGHLWVASDAGITRADTQTLLDCAQGRTCDLDASHVARFTTADGLRSRETSINSHPTVLRASDGRLWFTSPRGVVIADSLHFPANFASPPVAIERFAVDDQDQSVDPGGAMRIGAGHLRFQFDYAGLSFASPQRVHYQCILEGFDGGWTDVGTRRTAYYTNIPPGPYRFRVRAVMDDTGLPASSTPEETALAFVLLPHFYQTLWFRALIVAAVAGIIVLVFRRRVIRVEREFGAVMAERNRIAREIHDTLAQGYVGISLQLEILGELLRHKRTDAATTHLAMTQELVREGLDDARQSIWALRSQDAGEQTMPIRVRRLVEQAASQELSTDLEVHGAYRPLGAETEKEVLRIVQEAIQNVKRHAAASRMKVRLEYDQRALAVTVTDDGKGFDNRRERPATTGGHYGLTGMHERATLIDGSIEINSEPGHGTTVRLQVPARGIGMRGRALAAADVQSAEINAKISKEQS